MAYVKTQNSLKWLNFNSLLNLKVAGTRGRKSKWDLELSPRVSNFMSWLLQYQCYSIAYLITQFWQLSKVSNFIK